MRVPPNSLWPQLLLSLLRRISLVRASPEGTPSPHPYGPLTHPLPQVIKGTVDVVAVLARAAAATLAWPPEGPTALAPPPTASVLPGSDPHPRHAGSSAAAAAPSALRLPAEVAAYGRHIRVALGAVEGWGRDSSSLIALPHGMEARTCFAVLTPRQALCDAPRLAAYSPGVGRGPGGSQGARAAGPAAPNAGRPTLEEGAPVSTAILFSFTESGKVLRFQARL